MKAHIEHGDFMMAVYNDKQQDSESEAKVVASLKYTNLFSLATIIISLILLILFFTLGSGYA